MVEPQPTARRAQTDVPRSGAPVSLRVATGYEMNHTPARVRRQGLRPKRVTRTAAERSDVDRGGRVALDRVGGPVPTMMTLVPDVDHRVELLDLVVVHADAAVRRVGADRAVGRCAVDADQPRRGDVERAGAHRRGRAAGHDRRADRRPSCRAPGCTTWGSRPCDRGSSRPAGWSSRASRSPPTRCGARRTRRRGRACSRRPARRSCAASSSR